VVKWSHDIGVDKPFVVKWSHHIQVHKPCVIKWSRDIRVRKPCVVKWSHRIRVHKPCAPRCCHNIEVNKAPVEGRRAARGPREAIATRRYRPSAIIVVPKLQFGHALAGATPVAQGRATARRPRNRVSPTLAFTNGVWERGGAMRFAYRTLLPIASACVLSACATRDPITRLVTTLNKPENNMWMNGFFAIIPPSERLPKSASTRQVVAQVFRHTGFNEGEVTSFRIVEVRPVELESPQTRCTAVHVATNLGPKIVLIDYIGGDRGWWDKVYNIPPQPDELSGW
jgi:hypothetical protein